MVIESVDGEPRRAHYPAATLDLWPVSDSLLILDSMSALPEWERVYGMPGTWRQARTVAGIEHDALAAAHKARRWARHMRVAAERRQLAAEVRAGVRK